MAMRDLKDYYCRGPNSEACRVQFCPLARRSFSTPKFAAGITPLLRAGATVIWVPISPDLQITYAKLRKRQYLTDKHVRLSKKMELTK